MKSLRLLVTDKCNRKCSGCCNKYFEGKMLRLNIFKEVLCGGVDLSCWKVKENIEWIENCPLPENEIFLKYKGAK